MAWFSTMTPHARCALLCASLLALLVGPAAAQTPAATIEDDGGTVVLESYADGALVAFGSIGTGTIPATGSGTRMMWHPAKAAFRAGEVSGTQWDNSNVGQHSAAFGIDTRASGTAAVAMGSGTSAEASALLTAGECNSTSTNHLFVVGNGTYDFGSDSCSGTSDALLLDPSGNLTVASTNNLSDRRLKTAIEPLGSGILGPLDALRPVRYEFKNQETRPSGEQIGLIAQDVQKEFPELVSEGEDGLLSLSYSKFTAVLLKGLQEQQTQIERQRATIDSLETRVQNIEDVQARLARLETQVQDRSVLAGVLSGRASTFGLGLLLGGLLGAGVLWRRRS